MTITKSSILLLGESDVGKTHYGAQLLRRLNSGQDSMALENSNNIQPFVETMDQISLGLSGRHTPRSESSISCWQVRRKSDNFNFELNWPDYGGEQITSIINDRRLSSTWRNSISTASAWALMIRPSRIRLPEDAMTRQVRLPASDNDADSALSPQARLIEILQMLKFKQAAYAEDWSNIPPLCVMLSCYDELNTQMAPRDYCDRYIPMLTSFLKANWPASSVKFFGVSPIGQTLSDSKPDKEYVATGPEKMGYVVQEDGTRSKDLFVPISWMLSASVFT